MCLIDVVGRGCANGRADVKTIQMLLNLNAHRFPLAAPLSTDGLIGQKTIDALAAFQATVLGLNEPQNVSPGSATLAALAAGMPPGLSSEKIHGIMANADSRRVATYSEVLLAKMKERSIDTPLRQAHFLAQVGHESGELRFCEEIASGEAYEGRQDLGNTQPGDGRRFKGRGLIQLTGRANYAAYGQAIGIDLCSNENWMRVATDPVLAVDVACWFWTKKGLNAIADRDDIRGITHRINGGENGLADRERQLGRGKFFLGVGAPSSDVISG